MSLIQESSVFQKTYGLLKEVHIARHTFAKAEKYTLGERLEQSVLNILLHITDAGQTRHEWKAVAIDAALRELENAKILIRLAWDLRQINDRRMGEWQESAQTVGRMLGGWRKVA